MGTYPGRGAKSVRGPESARGTSTSITYPRSPFFVMILINFRESSRFKDTRACERETWQALPTSFSETSMRTLRHPWLRASRYRSTTESEGLRVGIRSKRKWLVSWRNPRVGSDSGPRSDFGRRTFCTGGVLFVPSSISGRGSDCRGGADSGRGSDSTLGGDPKNLAKTASFVPALVSSPRLIGP